ncbi:NAD(P)H-hydrate epimerase [Tundrisphaera sp. TA3]|uniref:NAD(P)H-hydrate epimerase n=1 Tax=Tundrisphaera sp. TA3 TaxID=3435775 RepID=UPI003EBCE687
MPVRPLSRDEVRSIDARAAEELKLPTLALMENAGRGAAALIRDRIGSGRVVIACGPGNNGGDGSVVARHLDAWGFDVRVLWFVRPDRLKGDAAIQRDVVERSGIAATEVDDGGPIDGLWEGADWVVDGLLGTGLTREVEGPLASAIASINRSGRPVLALDLPSGLDADSGRPLGDAVRATLTATFVAPKLGFSQPGASVYTGEVAVVDIGVPRLILAPFLADR